MSVEQLLYLANRHVDAIEERMVLCSILMVSMFVVIVACFIVVAIVAAKDRLSMKGY